MASGKRCISRLALGLTLASSSAGQLLAQSPAPPQPGVEKASAVTPTTHTSSRPEPIGLEQVETGHALLPVIQYARKEQAYLRQAVRDFTCRLVKRERIHGILQDHQYIDLWVREEVRSGQRAVVPLSIYMEFLAPKNVSGRRVLFVNGQNDGKMLVRNGGKHFDYVVVDVDPFGESAKEESLVPVTETGFNQILTQMIAVLERHATADPTGQNTRVEQVSGAKLDKRPCKVIRITHPRHQPGFEFHQANVFVDDELHVPVRVDYADFPAHEGGTPPLIAEYTYTNLKMNVGLSEASFSPRLLRAKRAK
ncbi:MAG: DUF1571 domain-containing protein [Pirellulales bacterium]